MSRYIMNVNEILFFGVFLFFVLILLFIDLGIFNKKSHVVTFKEAVLWTSIWVTISLLFYIFILCCGDLLHGINSVEDIEILAEKFNHSISIDPSNFEESLKAYKQNLALEYITGYLIEYTLSVDNVFVMILIFIAFGVRQKYYKRVLFWGILGAVVMRFIFIFLCSVLIQKFSWVLFLFGLLLIFTGIKMFINRNKEGKIDTQKHPVVKFTSRYFAVFPRYVGHHFCVKKGGKTFITPLLIVLLVIECMDVIFAVDSVPAIFSVTKDPYIVFFSNIFAIIGLRSLFFLIMNVMRVFHYLKIGLSVLLTFIGCKMIFHEQLLEVGFTIVHSLYIVVFILAASIILSLIFPKRNEEKL